MWCSLSCMSSKMTLLIFYNCRVWCFCYRDLLIRFCHEFQPHLGKQPIARWYFPPEVDYRLEALPPNAKGLVVWIIEAKVRIRPLFYYIRIKKVYLCKWYFGFSLGSLQGRIAIPCFATYTKA